MSRRSEAFLITKQFPRREETIVAVASLLKNLTVTGGVRKLMIHDKTEGGHLYFLIDPDFYIS